MKTYTVCRAEPITENEPVETAVLIISNQLPTKGMKLKEVEIYFKQEAEIIVDALCNHLPQGTRHQVLIELLKRTINLYHGK